MEEDIFRAAADAIDQKGPGPEELLHEDNEPMSLPPVAEPPPP